MLIYTNIKSWLIVNNLVLRIYSHQMSLVYISVLCRSDQYQCKDESCISPLFVCDGTPNCPDASDESPDCGKYTCTVLLMALLFKHLNF